MLAFKGLESDKMGIYHSDWLKTWGRFFQIDALNVGS